MMQNTDSLLCSSVFTLQILTNHHKYANHDCYSCYTSYLFLQDEDRADGEYSELQAVSQLCVPGSGSAHWTSWSWKVELLQLYQLCIQRPRHQPGHVWQLHHQPHHTGQFLMVNDFCLW